MIKSTKSKSIIQYQFRRIYSTCADIFHSSVNSILFWFQRVAKIQDAESNKIELILSWWITEAAWVANFLEYYFINKNFVYRKRLSEYISFKSQNIHKIIQDMLNASSMCNVLLIYLIYALYVTLDGLSLDVGSMIPTTTQMGQCSH